MQAIGNLLSYERPKTKIKSERAEILKQFLDELTISTKIENWRRFVRLNASRRKIGQRPLLPEEFKKHELFLKPYKPSYIGFRLAHIKDKSDLFYLLSICRDGKKRGVPFSKVFFGSIKIKK